MFDVIRSFNLEEPLDNLDRLSNKSARNVEIGIRALAESLGEGLLVIQRNEIVFMNDRLPAIMGMTRDELSGIDLTQLGNRDPDIRKYLETRTRYEETDDSLTIGEIRIPTSDGKFVIMRNRSSRIIWGDKPATVHFLEDITLRKNAEKQLMEQKEVNSILADTVRRILASPESLDEIAGTVLDSAMNLTGSRSGVLIIEDETGQKVLKQRCTGGCSSGCVIPSVLQSLKSDESMMNLRRPGRIEGAFYLNESLPVSEGCRLGSEIKNILEVPFHNQSPVFGHIILADSPETFGPWDLDNMEKIAEVLNLALVRRQAVDELKKAKDAAEREAEARSQFLANVSHEIRSPLNGVLMMSSLLQDSDLSDEQSELLNVVMFSARTIDRLIRDLTDLTQIRNGKITIFREDFNLDELCRHILESNRPEAVRKGLELESRIDPEAFHITGDRERIGQIISNLLTNAIKYTESGRILLGASVADDQLRIVVSDTGIGIPDEQQEEVFGLFNQGRLGRRADGTGIGLAVVKELTEIMKGNVSLESQPGVGSRFSVFLPLITPADSRDSDFEESASDTMPEIARILIAEDEGVNRLYMRTFLEREGWEIDEAANGIEAVSLAGKHHYDLILMDISMPRMDGLEASARIREIQPFVPIIAITAHAYEEDRKRILETGLNDIVLKPIDENGLKRRLRRYLRTS